MAGELTPYGELCLLYARELGELTEGQAAKLLGLGRLELRERRGRLAQQLRRDARASWAEYRQEHPPR